MPSLADVLVLISPMLDITPGILQNNRKTKFH